MKKLKQYLLNSFLVFSSFFIVVLIFEGFLRLTSDATDVEDLLRHKGKSELFRYAGIGHEGRCSWLDSHYTHPVLIYAQHDLDPCGWKINSMNALGKDFAPELSDEFVILFLGGSVAQQVSAGVWHTGSHNHYYIENALNRKYKPPGKRTFRVVTGAMGGWKQPNQILMLTKYLDRADVFVSLEGYNERLSVQNLNRIETPAYPYFINAEIPDARSYYRSFFFPLKHFILGSSLLKSSYLVIEIYSKLHTIMTNRFNRELQESQILKTFKYPDEYSVEEKLALGLKQYLSYVVSMDAVGQAKGKKGVFFLQPFRGLYKKLDPREAQSLTNADLYLDIEKGLSKLNYKSLKFISLLKLYEKTDAHIYLDDVHARIDYETGESLGYEMMAEAIADHLAKTFQFKTIDQKQRP